MSSTNPNPRINIDEDVDDLDDVLDQFSPNPIPAPPPTATLRPHNVGRPRRNTRVEREANEVDASEEFAKELAKGMETLMRELGEELPTGEDDEKKGVDFKARLKNALNNLKESESKLQGASGTGDSPTPEPLEALLRSLNDGDPDDNFLETMMGQLLGKEVLQEPLQELSDGFPGYLAKPPTPLSEDDRQRYIKQQACVSKILGVFNMPDYRDDHPVYPKEIMELMSELQSYGIPPSEIIGNLPPGFDTFDKFDEKDCHVS